MIRTAQGCVVIEGDITMETAPALLEQGAALCSQVSDGPDLTVDLSGVGKVDSAAVALLLDWARRTHAEGRRLCLRQASDPLRALVALYDLSEILVLEASPS